MTFLAKGILDPKNKNSALNNLLVVADIELNEGNYKYPVLKSASIVENPMKVTNDYYYLCSLMLMAEVTKTLVQDDEKERILKEKTLSKSSIIPFTLWKSQKEKKIK